MVKIKFTSNEVTFLYKHISKITRACGCTSNSTKQSASEVRDVIEKAYHSISQGHTEHEIEISDDANKFVHNKLLKFQEKHKADMSNEELKEISSLIESFSHC